jgi:FkbH-like protein
MDYPLTTATLASLKNQPTYQHYLAAANAISTTPPDTGLLSPVRIAILRNFTVEPLVPVLKGEAALSGFYPVIYLGNYNAIAADTLNPYSDLYAFQPDIIILAQWLETLSPLLADRFLSLTPEQIEQELESVLEGIEQHLAAIRQSSRAPILLNNFPLPFYPTLGILDAQAESYQTYSILRLNQQLTRRIKQWADVYVVNYMGLMAQHGLAQSFDERQWHTAHAPLARHSIVPLGQEYGKFLRALRGKPRKCLVLDCDNTLWGGILGEDGLNGIQLGSTYPGSAYQAFQRELLNLYDRGVILALCSKNNQADVLEVLHRHPDMILREEHFATWQINWDDKATNLRRIAADLNIGTEALVFVDDSQFECDLVCQQLPEVTVLQLPAEPATFRRRLTAAACFDTLSFSTEDRQRSLMYQADKQRKEMQQHAGSLPEYLTRLQMVAEIAIPGEMEINRISQLTQKTNQFNLTTRRYSPGEIQAFVDSPETDVLYLKLRDKIADLGLVGVAIVRYNRDQVELDTFLLSCRAIGRGAEDALLAHVLNHAVTHSYRYVKGIFIKTAKNQQVAEFYGRHNFQQMAQTETGSDWWLELTQQDYVMPKWIQVVLPSTS